VLGVNFKGKVEGPMQNSYLGLESQPAGGRHAILAGLEDTPRIINGTFRVNVEGIGKPDNRPLTLIPSYPDLPMEMVYPRIARTDIPEVYLRETGGSRIVYFPWDIDRTFWEVMAVDHGKLLRNSVEWAANEDKPVSVTGPGVLDVTAWRQKDSMTIHLVNLTNPMMMKGPFRELIPITEQRVRVRVPQGQKAKTIQLLVSDRSPNAEESKGVLTITVPSILDHEVVAIDLVSN